MSYQEIQVEFILWVLQLIKRYKKFSLPQLFIFWTLVGEPGVLAPTSRNEGLRNVPGKEWEKKYETIRFYATWWNIRWTKWSWCMLTNIYRCPERRKCHLWDASFQAKFEAIHRLLPYCYSNKLRSEAAGKFKERSGSNKIKILLLLSVIALKFMTEMKNPLASEHSLNLCWVERFHYELY